MSAPESSRRYGWIDDDIRELAVTTVRDLLPHVGSLWAACREVSLQLSVHPNTIKNWYQSAHRDDPDHPLAPSKELATAREELRALRQLNDGLIAALKDRNG